MKTTNKKGFTLIELLIVIAIIGILAVAFLPTLLGAPSKGRDTSRIADLQKIQKVLIDNDLAGNPYPTVSGPVDPGENINVAGDTWGDTFSVEFGGSIPSDPQNGNVENGNFSDTEFYEYVAPDDAGDFSFVLVSFVENFENANADCASAMTGTLADPTDGAGNEDTWCYAIFTQ